LSCRLAATVLAATVLATTVLAVFSSIPPCLIVIRRICCVAPLSENLLIMALSLLPKEDQEILTKLAENIVLDHDTGYLEQDGGQANIMAGLSELVR
jgi:hypothetical protein